MVGVVKSYTSRVGNGPFPTELFDSTGQLFQLKGNEIGATTHRKRRCGWLDLFLLRYTTMINGYTQLCLTKLDIFDELDEIKWAIGYKIDGKLLQTYPSSISQLTKVEVRKINEYFNQISFGQNIYRSYMKEWMGGNNRQGTLENMTNYQKMHKSMCKSLKNISIYLVRQFD